MPDKQGVKKIVGRRAVWEALRSKNVRVAKIMLAKGTHGTLLHEIRDTAQSQDVEIEWLDRHRLDKMAGPVPSQGVMALVTTAGHTDLTDLISRCQAQGGSALLVVCDEIEDPRNLGAIARCAEGAGAQGLIMTSRRSAEVTPVTEKAAGGALSHLAMTRVGNLANALEELKHAGLWIAGLAAEAPQTIWEADLKRPLVLVVGNEGRGLRRLTQEACDMLVRIPMQGQVNSLNVAVATGVALFEIQRQRRLPKIT